MPCFCTDGEKLPIINSFIKYDKLEKIGIDRRAFLSMPKNLVDPIINGKVSPIIKAHIKAENGKTIEMPMKIQLTHDDQGNVKLQTYPLRKEIANEFNLTTRELNRVKRGDVIRKEIEEDGIKKMKFIQLDNETLSLIPRSIAHVRIAEKLREMEKINDIECRNGIVRRRSSMTSPMTVSWVMSRQRRTVGNTRKSWKDFHEKTMLSCLQRKQKRKILESNCKLYT